MRLARIIRESKVEGLLVKLAKLSKCLALKFVSPGYNGMPDRMVLKGIDAAVRRWALRYGIDSVRAEPEIRDILASIIEFVELKAPGREATLLQLRRHEQLRALGFKVTVLDNEESVREWAQSL